MFKECLNIMDTIIIKQINEKDFTMNIGDLKTATKDASDIATDHSDIATLTTCNSICHR